MQYQVNTPQEYLDILEEDWRKEKVIQVWKLLEEEGPQLQPGIEYKMLSFADERGTVFNLNAQANYVSFYVGDTKKVDASGESLQGFNMGKGCIRIRKTNEVEKLRTFIQVALEKRKAGKDIGC
ncbi:MAG: DUF1801 domain-containing protein [Cytophagales bacterium]|nr:DUF1801 domain-containing protein [Cytophagales bacterium]